MKTILLLALSLLAGCATQGIGPPTPSETGGLILADKNQVTGCTFLGDVHGVSPLYGTHAASALREARAAALNEAPAEARRYPYCLAGVLDSSWINLSPWLRLQMPEVNPTASDSSSGRHITNSL